MDRKFFVKLKAGLTACLLMFSPAPLLAQVTPINPGETRAVDAHYVCRIVTNYTSTVLFVPHRYPQEWHIGGESFLARVPAAVGISQCCPHVGNYCPDGTIFAGMSPDGNKRMYTHPGLGPWIPFGSEGAIRWTSQTAGRWNTDIQASQGYHAHPAATHCRFFNGYGKDDWYLPAAQEAVVLAHHYHLVDPGSWRIGGVYPGDYINTSTEANASGHFAVWVRNRMVSSIPFPKRNGVPVRCVRRDH